jgi:hypothetical protein
LLCSLPSCRVAPPNVPVCIEDDINSGYCVRTISGEAFQIDDAHPYQPYTDRPERLSWLEMRPYMVLLPFQSWAEIKKFIIDACKLTKACSGPSVSNWERTVQSIDAETIQKGQP